MSEKKLHFLLVTVFLAAAIASSGCRGNGVGLDTSMPGSSATPPRAALLPFYDQYPAPGTEMAKPDGFSEYGDEPEPASDSAIPIATQAKLNPNLPANGMDTRPGAVSDERFVVREDSLLAGGATPRGTRPGGRQLGILPYYNPGAADLLDHWGHRRSQAIKEGLSLTPSLTGSDTFDLQSTQAAAERRSGTTIAPNLQDGDEVRIMGTRRGVTFGRWAGGPADTLSIDFDISGAGPLMSDDPAFLAMLERAGKAWSHRIADTWTPWERFPGDIKSWLARGDPSATRTEVRVGPEGEVSTGLEIDVRYEDFTDEAAGRGGGGIPPPGESWEPHFGSVVIDTDYLQKNHGTSRLFRVLTHEIGHVLGAWTPWMNHTSYPEHLRAYVDETTGAWTGPNVVALHGGPAPFQDASDAHVWVNGERDPNATDYDFAHSGVCASLMAYCNSQAALRVYLPDAIDFAFLKDIGMTITDETERSETYGLAGWTDYAAFTISVSRDLQIVLADPQPHYGDGSSRWNTLDVIDLLQAEVDAFGYLSTGSFRSSYTDKGPDGTVRYSGGLLGAVLDRTGLPPVTGDATLSVYLATLDGAASFTSLTVYPDGTPEVFAEGSLYYPIELSANKIIGTGAGSTFQADFYGPNHEDVAGVLHDPQAGLLASFGATLDERPSREDVIASADYLVGLSRQINTPDSVDEGWSHYRCGADASCEMRHNPTGPVSWSDWITTTRENVLVSTAGWDSWNVARTEAEHDFVRIERLTSASTDGARGRHVIDGYTGTMEYVAFGTGLEHYTNWTTEPDVISPDFEHRWTGVQGTLSGNLPGGRARWSGLMLGYQYNLPSSENRLVEGRTTVDYSLSTNLVDVMFSDVASRDGQRDIPDFGFENLQAVADGTFAHSDESGRIYGAFFGPVHEESGGIFHHYEADVFGSFGARLQPDTLTLEETGTTRALNSSEGYDFYAYDQWGFWAKQFQENIFGAFLEQDTTSTGNSTTYYSPFGRIEGTPSGRNPVSGSAVWSGKVRAVEMEPRGYTPVSGNARLEVDFGDATLNVDFTEFGEGHSDISWRALQIDQGAFRDPQVGNATIEGAFYGTDHQGVAGTFERNRLRGVFGGLRDVNVTEIVMPEESDLLAMQAPIVDFEGSTHIGANVAPPAGQLKSGVDYNGISVSSGQVQDGASADRVLEYLETHVSGGLSQAGEGFTFGAGTPGLPSFADRPTIRLAEGTSEEFTGYVVRAVQLINAALPYEKRIQFSQEPAPPLTAIEDVPDGQIFVDFAPSAEYWNLRPGAQYRSAAAGIAQIDPIQEFNFTAELWEYKNMRAGHVWMDVKRIANAAWVRNPVTGNFEEKVLENPVVESDTVRKVYPAENVFSIVLHELIHILGFLAHNESTRFPDSVMRDDYLLVTKHLPNIDSEALFAAYSRFEPGTQPEELTAENLGIWDDTSFHLLGELDFEGGEVSFGVAARNGLAKPWASGPKPWANLADNSALSGTVTWNGALLGITPSAETVVGGTRLAVELANLDGQLDFTGMEKWGANEAPGAVGSGTMWGDGELGYRIKVTKNTFVQTGGDEGQITGAFFGPAHEAMGGVLERSDLAAGFGGKR